MESTGLKMSERRAAWLKPSPVKNEEDIADAVESWEREELELRKLDPIAEEFLDVYRMIALTCLLAGRIQEHVELQSGRRMTYAAVRQEIMTYAAQRRRRG